MLVQTFIVLCSVLYSVSPYDLGDEENVLDRILAKVYRLEKNILMAKRENMVLHTEIVDLKKKLDSMENRKRELLNDFLRLAVENKDLKQYIQSEIRNKATKEAEVFTSNTIAHLFDGPSHLGFIGPRELKYKNDALRSRNAERKVRETSAPTGSTEVAFLAHHPNNQENLGLHQTVRFQSVITNVGLAYNPILSVFIAPTAGVYFFSVTILSLPGETVVTEIVRNGKSVANVYSGSEALPGSGTTFAVLGLKANDDVWVRVMNDTWINKGNIRLSGEGWSSFSGFRLF